MRRWHALEVDLLDKLWGHKTAAEIGALLSRTRNSVIGKANHLGLDSLKDLPNGDEHRTPYLHELCSWKYLRDQYYRY